MPNYGLVVTPQYNPMSYEQYAKPFEEYGKAYNAMADAYDSLETEADQWEKLAQNANDKAEYEKYKRYANDIRAAADDLATNGLNQRTRGTLSNLRKRYAQEIKPIADAYAYREKMADEQRKLNPTGDIQFDTDFSNIGLGAIMANPNLSYRGRSLGDIEKEAFEQAKSFSSRSLEARKATELGSQYYQILQGVGQDKAAEFLQKIRNGENPSFTAKDLQALDDLYQEIRDTRGTTATNSPYSAEQNAIADDRILSGMMKGLTLADSYQTNHWAMPGTSRGSGSGSAEAGIEAIGYSKLLNGREYTVTYEAGYPKYYDQAGNEYVPDFDDTHHNRYAFKDSQGNKHTIDFDNQSDKEKQISDRRYGISPVNNSGTMVYVVDLWNRDSSGQPKKVTQNGKNVTYDRSKQRWNPITKKVEDLEQISKTNKKVPKHKATRVIVGQTTGLWGANRIGNSEYLTDDDVTKLDPSKEIKYEDLTASEIEYIPDDVKSSSDNYIFYRYTKDDPGMFWTGDNDYIVYVPVSTVKSEGITENVEEEFNEDATD